MSGYPPPSASYTPTAAPAPRARPAGPIATLAGLAVTVLGLFALPLNDYAGGGVGFVQIRGLATDLADRGGPDVYGGLASFWWRFGAFVDLGLVTVALALLIGGASRLAAGLAVAVLAVAGGVVHGVAMATSADYMSFVRDFRRNGSSLYDRPAAGIWVSLAGFALLAVAGVLTAVSGRTRSAAPPPPPPAPAAPPR